MPLRTNITVGEAGHDALHNEERAAVNLLGEVLKVVPPGSLLPAGSTDADNAARAASNAAVVAAVIADRPNLRTVIPAGDWPMALSIIDQPVRLRVDGTLIACRGTKSSQADTIGAAPAPAISVRYTYGAPVAVTQGTTQFGPNLPAGGIFTQTVSTLTVTGGNHARFRNGDAFQIHSQDAYPWTQDAFGNDFCWRAEFFSLHSIGLDLSATANGGPLESMVLKGATSNVSALTTGAVAQDATNARVTFASVSGDFTPGENILNPAGQVIGVAGAMYLIVFGRLGDTYTTTPVIRQVPKSVAVVDIDAKVKASGDTDTFVDPWNRTVGIFIAGGHKIKVKADFASSWDRGLQVRSCYIGDLDVTADGLPNHALESGNVQGAYGYGVEVLSSSAYLRVKVMGNNLRHAFSTNPGSGTYNQIIGTGTVSATSTATNHLTYGTPRHTYVHDSKATNCYAAGFDTHVGAWYTTFDNCDVINSAALGRSLTNGAGFNNRSFATTFRNCTAYYAFQGFAEGGVASLAGQSYVTRYINCSAIDFQNIGFIASNSSGGFSRLELQDCHMRGDGSAANFPFFQYPYQFGNGTVTTYNCRSSRFNGPPMYVSGGGRHIHRGFFADYSDSTGSSGIRVGSTLGALIFTGKLHVHMGGSGKPISIFRNVAGDTPYQYDEIVVTSVLGNGIPATFPPLASVDAGVPTFTPLGDRYGATFWNIDGTVKAAAPTGYTPGTPTVAAGAGAGTTPPAPTLVAGSNDAAGEVWIGTGTTPAAGTLVTVTFGTPYTTAPNVVISPTNQTTASRTVYVGGVTTTNFVIGFASTPAASQGTGVYRVGYQVKGS